MPDKSSASIVQNALLYSSKLAIAGQKIRKHHAQAKAILVQEWLDGVSTDETYEATMGHLKAAQDILVGEVGLSECDLTELYDAFCTHAQGEAALIMAAQDAQKSLEVA